jgi:hypothetical protein
MKLLKNLLILKLVAMVTLAHAQVFVPTIPRIELRNFENNLLAKTSVYMQYEVRNISDCTQQYLQENGKSHYLYNLNYKPHNEIDSFLFLAFKNELIEQVYLEKMFFVFDKDTFNVSKAGKNIIMDLQPNETVAFEISIDSYQIATLYYRKYISKFSTIERFVKYFLKEGCLYDCQKSNIIVSKTGNNSKINRRTIWY